MAPLISVLMPAYNAEMYISKAIKSILNQTYHDFEFIIINDGSNDKTEEIILSFDDGRIVYVKNDINIQLIKSLNKGIELARGQFIARMDADDIALPDMLESSLNAFILFPNISVVNGLDYEFTEDERFYFERPFNLPLSFVSLKYTQLLSNQILHPGVMIKTDVFRKYKYRDLDWVKHHEDNDLWERLLRDGHVIYSMEKYVILHRQTLTSITGLQLDISNNTLYFDKKLDERKIVLDEVLRHFILRIFSDISYNSIKLFGKFVDQYFEQCCKENNVPYFVKLELNTWKRLYVIRTCLSMIKSCTIKGKLISIIYLLSKIRWVFDYKVKYQLLKLLKNKKRLKIELLSNIN